MMLHPSEICVIDASCKFLKMKIALITLSLSSSIIITIFVSKLTRIMVIRLEIKRIVIPVLLINFLLAGMCESFRVPLRSLYRIATTTRTRIVIKKSAAATTTRLFGTKRGIQGNPPGCISIYNDQKSIKGINEDAISATISKISKLIGYDTYDVTVLLVDDEEMRETNLESRGIDSPTDILSFPFHQPDFTTNDNKAGLLEEPEFDIPDYYTLGDMVICVPYVIRRCQEDILALGDDNDYDDDESDVGGVENDGDRGVSGAMADVRDPEKRIRMLLVHGMLHLVGYDHIEDEDYIEMVEREEEILKEIGDIL